MLSLDFKERMNKTLYERYSMASVMCRCYLLPSMSCRNCPSIYRQKPWAIMAFACGEVSKADLVMLNHS